MVLAKNASNASGVDQAGLTLGGGSFSGTKPTFTYSSSDNRWNPNIGMNLPSLYVNGIEIGEYIDSQVSTSLMTEGEAIDLTYNDAGNSLTIAAETATKNNLGAASFDSAHFTISSGHISIPTMDGGTY